MRFYTALYNEQETPFVSFDGGKKAFTLSSLGFSYEDLNHFILEAAQNAALYKELQSFADGTSDTVLFDTPVAVPVSGLTLLAPIVRPMQDVVCLGINYAQHAEEAGKFSQEAFGGDRPATIYFAKRVNRATADGEKIPSHKDIVDSLDYECELGVILKKDALNVSMEDAASYVLGYTIINDVSARNLQTRHKQWYFGKSLDGFTPMGPCIVTSDEIGDATELDIRCTVNDTLRQSSNTRLMIQTVAGAIAELSKGMTLQAGTIIAMGTPAGVGMGMTPPTFLNSGDKIICEIQKIGTLTNVVE